MTTITGTGNEYFQYTHWTDAGSPIEVVLGEGWAGIGTNAFRSTAIASIHIPASVTSIGHYAFQLCASLTTVTFAANSLLETIGVAAFQDTALASIEIPASVTSIGDQAFLGCTRLASVTFAAVSGLLTIENSVFQHTAITSIIIPASVTSIGKYVFYNLTNFDTVTFADIENSNLTTIDTGAFRNTGITTIEIPASVTTIGGDTFKGTTSLTTITFATGSVLGAIIWTTFMSSAITSIEIPASVTNIGNGAFKQCASLTSVTFAEGSQLATIGTSIFTSSGLTTFTAPQQVLTVFGVTVSPPVQTVGGKSGVTVTLPPSPPTCFPAGTPIQTDQGVTAIEQLVPGEHTLRGKSIIAITQTRPLQKHIVCFEKDSIGKNVPSQQTLCSKEHKVLYQGEMIKARDLADMCKNVKKVSYNGETLYNVLLEKHGKMLVNNMICETLHPENIAAKFAKSKSSPSKRAIA